MSQRDAKLAAFLDSHKAATLAVIRGPKDSSFTIYQLESNHFVIVQRHGQAQGWELFITASLSNEIDATLNDADRIIKQAIETQTAEHEALMSVGKQVS